MTFRGMDLEATDALAGRLQLQAQAVAAIVTVVDGAVAGLAGVWSGDDLHAFTAVWQQTHRVRAQSLSGALAGWVTELRRQVNQQTVASSSGTSSLAAASGATLTASAMLTFAKGSEGASVSLPKGWKAATPAELRSLGIDSKSLHDKGTGLDATIYTDHHGHYVISYAGSAGQWYERDWREDGKGVVSPLLPNVSGQAQGAADLAYQLVARAGPGNVTLTGHSLGGRDAAVAAVASGAAAVTFNAAAVTDEDLLYARELSGHHVSLGGYLLDKASDGQYLRDSVDQSKITNYVISDDVVTGGQDVAHVIAGERTALGLTDVVPTDTANPFDAHNLNNFDGKL